MALNVAGQGNDVIITYYTRKEEAEKVVAKIEKIGGKARAIHLDVSDASNISAFASRMLQTEFSTSKLDALINNAGIGYYEPIVNATGESLDNI